MISWFCHLVMFKFTNSSRRHQLNRDKCSKAVSEDFCGDRHPVVVEAEGQPSSEAVAATLAACWGVSQAVQTFDGSSCVRNLDCSSALSIHIFWVCLATVLSFLWLLLVLFVIKHFTRYTLCCRTHLTTLSHLLAVGGVTTVRWSELWHVNSLQSLCWEIGDKSSSWNK